MMTALGACAIAGCARTEAQVTEVWDDPFPGLHTLTPPLASQELAGAETELKWRQFLRAAREADGIHDPRERCLRYPDLPNNHWPEGLAKSNCDLAYGSGISAERFGELMQAGNVSEIEAFYAADQARHFSKKDFSEAIHGDYYFFDGGELSDSLSSLWLDKSPASPYALMARGNHLLNAARRVRAARPEANMSVEEIQQMQSLGAKSAEMFRKAAAINPKMIEAYNGLAHVGTITSISDAEDEGIAKGRDADKYCAALAVQEMWALTPRWGGSEEAMRARSVVLSKAVGKRPLLSLAIVMPAVEHAWQLKNSNDREQRKEAAALLRPAALATTSPDVSESLGDTTWAPKVGASEHLVHLIGAHRFQNGGIDIAVRRASAILDAQMPPSWAARSLRAAMDFHPGYVPAYHFLARAEYLQSDYTGAERDAKIALADERLRAETQFLLAQIYAMSNRLPEARAMAEEYRRAEPEATERWDWLQAMFAQKEAVPTAR